MEQHRSNIIEKKLEAKAAAPNSSKDYDSKREDSRSALDAPELNYFEDTHKTESIATILGRYEVVPDRVADINKNCTQDQKASLKDFLGAALFYFEEKTKGTRVKGVTEKTNQDELITNMLKLAKTALPTIEKFKAYIDKVFTSKLLTGQTKSGWVADISWVMRPQNVINVLEGKYHDKIDSLNKENIIAFSRGQMHFNNLGQIEQNWINAKCSGRWESFKQTMTDDLLCRELGLSKL
jgi:hypothetical protein